MLQLVLGKVPFSLPLLLVLRHQLRLLKVSFGITPPTIFSTSTVAVAGTPYLPRQLPARKFVCLTFLLLFLLLVTFGGIALFYGGWNFHYPTAIVVMVVSVGFLVWARKWFE